MPRNAKSNGIPPQVRALAVIKLGVPVTPSEINKCVDTGNYASKWVLYLKIMGFHFTVNKNGRNVVSYTMIMEPENAAELRAMQPKGSKVKKPAKTPANKNKKAIDQFLSSVTAAPNWQANLARAAKAALPSKGDEQTKIAAATAIDFYPPPAAGRLGN